jgi:hypothetical protein
MSSTRIVIRSRQWQAALIQGDRHPCTPLSCSDTPALHDTNTNIAHPIIRIQETSEINGTDTVLSSASRKPAVSVSAAMKEMLVGTCQSIRPHEVRQLLATLCHQSKKRVRARLLSVQGGARHRAPNRQLSPPMKRKSNAARHRTQPSRFHILSLCPCAT